MEKSEVGKGHEEGEVKEESNFREWPGVSLRR